MLPRPLENRHDWHLGRLLLQTIDDGHLCRAL